VPQHLGLEHVDPVLIVSEKTWPQDGFSRKRSIRPSSSVTTIPNSSGLSTDLSPIVTAASRSLWTRMISVRSTSQSASPEMTRKVSSSLSLASRTEPAVPSGDSSTSTRSRPEPLAVAEVAADRLRHERDGHDHLVEAVLLEQLDDVLHARLADDRHHRLGLVRGQRAQARALAAGHHDRLHAVVTSRRALSR
jgi:hypothetical protein